MARTAEDLARQTESNAAALEETSAAIVELTQSARATSVRAAEADAAMARAREEAEGSMATVESAVSTMSEIAASSAEISKIVGLIEDIAFQTSLLALNAGVEAARAGEQGRGFAVVAQEVRSLAQKSSDSARDINRLITSARAQIGLGVEHVGEAGKALTGILGLVAEVSGSINAISAAARTQSEGFVEISGAVRQLDEATQRSAGMFSETVTATRGLTDEAQRLSELAATFRTGSAEVEGHHARPRGPALVA
jgi:methyl-accepting chemotaxis protein